MKKRSIVIILIAIFVFSMAGGAYWLYRSQDTKMLKFKRYVKTIFVNSQLPQMADETVGLGKINKTELYENNSLVARDKINFSKDNKKVYITDDKKRLINYTSGYRLDFQKNTTFSFEYSPIFTKAKNNDYEVTITTETSPYDDVDEYFAYYLNRFILSPDYQKANKIDLVNKEDITLDDKAVQIISIKINNLTNGKPDAYSYVLIKTNTRAFYRLAFKYKADDKNMIDKIKAVASSFAYFKPYGYGYYDLDFKPSIPKKWTKETADLYEKIKNTKEIYWGMFAKDIYGEGIEKTIPSIEKTIEYKFPVILSYVHFKTPFPKEFMQKNYEDGRIVELTYQLTESNNEKLFEYTPNIDLYRGLKDEDIRAFAEDAKAFGHPFLFRLNNEMNSDWTSYSGVINLADPDVYIDNWQRIYRIFEEEGVNNVIWIYNPNDRNFPPCNWNNYLAYYPGNKYVQLIGVTGYNTGTYYKDVTGEEWREFDTIYSDIQEKYEPFFKGFPWIITEFASSSVGGNKVKWIDNMFKNIHKYPNIKIAVWFNYADFDFRPEKAGIQSRPYWLNETPQTLDAFKRGIKLQQNK